MHETFVCPLKDGRRFTGARAAVSFTSHMLKHGWANSRITAERTAQRAAAMRATAETVAGLNATAERAEHATTDETPGVIPPGGDVTTLADKIAEVNTALDAKRAELQRLNVVSREVESLVSQLDILERAQRELMMLYGGDTLYGDSSKGGAAE